MRLYQLVIISIGVLPFGSIVEEPDYAVKRCLCGL
jgi:hypothetical protein